MMLEEALTLASCTDIIFKTAEDGFKNSLYAMAAAISEWMGWGRGQTGVNLALTMRTPGRSMASVAQYELHTLTDVLACCFLCCIPFFSSCPALRRSSMFDASPRTT